MATPDDDRYLHRFDVIDAMGRPGVVRVGAEGGTLMVDGPRHWRAPSDELFEAAFAGAIVECCRLANAQRRQ